MPLKGFAEPISFVRLLPSPESNAHLRPVSSQRIAARWRRSGPAPTRRSSRRRSHDGIDDVRRCHTARAAIFCHHSAARSWHTVPRCREFADHHSQSRPLPDAGCLIDMRLASGVGLALRSYESAVFHLHRCRRRCRHRRCRRSPKDVPHRLSRLAIAAEQSWWQARSGRQRRQSDPSRALIRPRSCLGHGARRFGAGRPVIPCTARVCRMTVFMKICRGSCRSRRRNRLHSEAGRNAERRRPTVEHRAKESAGSGDDVVVVLTDNVELLLSG